jgi:hypothetical protein
LGFWLFTRQWAIGYLYDYYTSKSIGIQDIAVAIMVIEWVAEFSNLAGGN